MHFFSVLDQVSRSADATITSPTPDRTPVAELEKIVARQALLIETLTRLLMAKGVVQEPELDQWLDYVDRLDGVSDGKLRVRKSPSACPSCKRASPPTAVKCIYCGSEFSTKFLADPAENPNAPKEK